MSIIVRSGRLYSAAGREQHDDQIWSRALWDIRRAIGHIRADTVILEAQFGFPGGMMPDLAARTVSVADDYGKRVADQVTAAFEARGIV